ncbi:hypothetical protein HK096_009160 [Nowakowskiella sp. JEL0078]|nr:hypothetical protein HK096_009160 [Nowakowskiella sp. JEL0078]
MARLTHLLLKFPCFQARFLSTEKEIKRLVSVQQSVSRGVEDSWKELLRKSKPHDSPDTQLFSNNLRKSNLSKLTSLSRTIKSNFISAFLPKGFPHTVSKDYLPYTSYFFIQSVTGTITSTLSLQALLLAIGLSSQTALGLAATTTWIVKDGLGLLGGVIYASVISNKFDSHPKQFRFSSAVVLQVATVAELVTPLVPGYFLLLASVSNIAKNIAWLASSATRASMHKGFCVVDNLGDVTGKAGAQSTAAGLVGTAGGILISWMFGAGYEILTGVFGPLLFVNLCAAYLANVAVATRTLDVQRAELLLASVTNYNLIHKSLDKTVEFPGGGVKNGQLDYVKLIPSPEDIAPFEKFVLPFKSCYQVPLFLDPKLEPVLEKLIPDQISEFLVPGDADADEYRILAVPGSWMQSKKCKGSKNIVCVWYTDKATSKDVLKGFYHSCILRSKLVNEDSVTFELSKNLVDETKKIVDRDFEEIWSISVDKAWDLNHLHISSNGSRIRINYL